MICIYGKGKLGKIFSRIIKTDYFIDKYKKGEKILSLNEIPKDAVIYNSVAALEDEVFKDLRGFNIKSFKESINEYPEIIKEIYKEGYVWLDGKLLDDRLNEVRRLLKDEISLIFFDKWIKFRENLDIKYYPDPTSSLEKQYFINEFKYSKRFVDCGGYVGDTIARYFKYNRGGMVISFEPDKENLAKLRENAKKRNVLIYPMGVWSKTDILKYNPQGSSGNIDEDGKIEVAVTSLDETVYSFRPDYIKMDIEGAETEAIKGAVNIIKDFSPNLAISIYHKASDLWEIPLLIREINPNYEFKIRCHNNICLETILYCKVKK